MTEFENKQLSDVAKYLSIVEEVKEQNVWVVDRRQVAMCTAVLGAKLKDTVNLDVSYEAIR